MNTLIKNLLFTFIVIAAPGVLVDLVLYTLPDSGSIMMIAGLYVTTIIGVLLFYRFKPCSMWVLPLAFVPPVIICYVKDTLDNSEWLTYLYTILVLIYYSLPLILITFSIAFVSAIRTNEGRKRHFHLRNLTLREVQNWIKRKRKLLLSASVLVLVFLCIAVMWSESINRRHMVRRDIIQKIDMLTKVEETCVFKLSEVTDFKWDRVVYFKYPISQADISRSAGINYKRSTDMLEGFIFIYQGKVVYEDVVSIAPGSNDKVSLGFKGDSLTVLREEDAFFEGWKIRNKFYRIKLVDKPY